MRDDVGLELRQEFEEAVETVEAKEVEPSKALAPKFPADVMAEFHATESDLKAMAARATGLKINGLADKQGYAAAHAARMELRDARILIDKARKVGNDDAQAAIKMRNNVAKYLTSIIAPYEDALDAEEAKYAAEVEAEKKRKQAETAAALQKRIEALQAVGHPVNLAEVTLMSEAQFGFVLASATDAFKAREAQRIENEALAAKAKAEQEAKDKAAAEAKAEAERIERERLAQVAREQAETARKQAEAQAELDRQAAALKAKQEAQERAEREKEIAEKAAAKAKAEAERIAAEEAARKEKERMEAIERAKAAEAAKPDADKIRALAATVRGTAFPKLSTDAGKAAMSEIETCVERLAVFIEKKADALSPATFNVAP